MNNNKKVLLFYANWCGHCQTFMPTWTKLKKAFDTNNIQYEQHESANEEIMNKFNIQGYPTIKILQNNIATDYNGIRNYDGILNYLGVPSQQSGGFRNNIKIYNINYQSERHMNEQSGGNNELVDSIDSVNLPTNIEF